MYNYGGEFAGEHIASKIVHEIVFCFLFDLVGTSLLINKYDKRQTIRKRDANKQNTLTIHVKGK